MHHIDRLVGYTTARYLSPMGTREDILEILKRHTELPSHYFTRLLGKSERSPKGFRNCNEVVVLKRMADAGEIYSYSSPNNKNRNVSKHLSYSLSAPGFKDRNQRPERLLQSIIQADTEIGVMDDENFEFISFADLLKSPDALPRPLLDLIDQGGDPFLVPLANGSFKHDGAPMRIYSKSEDDHWNYIDEIDRNTEPLTSTKRRRSIEQKWEHYYEFFSKELYKTHYGFQNCKLRFITIDEANMHSAMRLWEKKYGNSPDILFATTKDYIYEVSFPRGEEIGQTFRQPYLRVGHPDWYMNKIKET